MQIIIFVLSLKYFLGSLKEYFEDLMKYFPEVTGDARGDEELLD